MSKFIPKSLVWVPFPGMDRNAVIADLSAGTAAFHDAGDHVWSIEITHRGPVLFCYGIQPGPFQHAGREVTVWHVKRIPEADGPDVFDVPQEILDQAPVTNVPWREKVRDARHKGV